MKRLYLVFAVAILVAGQANAHSGGTDSRGGHNCSEASKKKGLCSGYHYHSGGGLHSDATDELVSAEAKQKIELDFPAQSHPHDDHDHEIDHNHDATDEHKS